MLHVILPTHYHQQKFLSSDPFHSTKVTALIWAVVGGGVGQAMANDVWEKRGELESHSSKLESMQILALFLHGLHDVMIHVEYERDLADKRYTGAVLWNMLVTMVLEITKM